MTSLGSRVLTCPNCARTFESTVVLSTNNFGGLHTDFREEAAGLQPREFLIHRCAHCGFCGAEPAFEQEVSDVTARKISDVLTPQADERPFPPWRKVEHAALIAEWATAAPEEIAHLYLMAAHVCADCGAEEEGGPYRARAIEFFQETLNQNASHPQAPAITYLIGELYRRIGRSDEAAAWLSRAEGMCKANENLAWLGDLAKRQKENPEERVE